VIFIPPAVIFGGASRTSVIDARTFGDDDVTEQPASLPKIPSSMIEILVDRLDVGASMPDIRDAPPRITARRTDDGAEGIEIPEAPTSGTADGIDEPAEGMDEGDAGIEIHDDRTNVIDAMTKEHDDRLDVVDPTPEKPARPTDPSAKEGEVPDEPIDRAEGRTNVSGNRQGGRNRRLGRRLRIVGARARTRSVLDARPERR